MTAVEYPSQPIPGPVPIRVEVPDGWVVGPAPLVVFVATAPDQVDGLVTNAIVASQRVVGSLGADEISAVAAVSLQGFERATVTEEETVSAGDLTGVFRVVDLPATEMLRAVTVIQVAVLAILGGGFAELVTLTITHSAGAPADHREMCRQIAASLRVGAAASPDSSG